MKYYIYQALSSHPCNGMLCTIGWFYSDARYCHVYFVDEDPRGLGFDIANFNDLEEV